METRTAVERLQISDCAPYRFAHIMYENFYQGRIAEVPYGYRASIHAYHFGEFATFEEARAAVILWFSGLDIQPN
jgi:hypothetical protein